jgi:hypothetical protein
MHIFLPVFSPNIQRFMDATVVSPPAFIQYYSTSVFMEIKRGDGNHLSFSF